ncbi:MAG: shikimate kinase [Cardiobacteriales bacterium]|nr:MAG: shikimate kinase [Cardiobacteriales bacterium]
MWSNRKVVLIGPMGAGKTSLGRRLADTIGWQFIDTDQKICQRTGVDIPTIFDREGEGGFRRRESEVLAEVLSFSGDWVVACGGGIVLKKTNRQLISKQFLVIFLDVSIPRQLQRVGNDKNRPLINMVDKEAQLKRLSDERLGLYEGLADVRINTDNNNFSQSFKKLVKALKKQCGF